MSDLKDYRKINGVMSAHIIPTDNAQYDLGNAEYKIRHLFLSDNSLWIGEQNKVDIDGQGNVRFRRRLNVQLPHGLRDVPGLAFDEHRSLKDLYDIAEQNNIPVAGLWGEDDFEDQPLGGGEGSSGPTVITIIPDEKTLGTPLYRPIEATSGQNNDEPNYVPLTHNGSVSDSIIIAITDEEMSVAGNQAVVGGQIDSIDNDKANSIGLWDITKVITQDDVPFTGVDFGQHKTVHYVFCDRADDSVPNWQALMDTVPLLNIFDDSGNQTHINTMPIFWTRVCKFDLPLGGYTEQSPPEIHASPRAATWFPRKSSVPGFSFPELASEGKTYLQGESATLFRDSRGTLHRCLDLEYANNAWTITTCPAYDPKDLIFQNIGTDVGQGVSEDMGLQPVPPNYFSYENFEVMNSISWYPTRFLADSDAEVLVHGKPESRRFFSYNGVNRFAPVPPAIQKVVLPKTSTVGRKFTVRNTSTGMDIVHVVCPDGERRFGESPGVSKIVLYPGQSLVTEFAGVRNYAILSKTEPSEVLRVPLVHQTSGLGYDAGFGPDSDQGFPQSLSGALGSGDMRHRIRLSNILSLFPHVDTIILEAIEPSQIIEAIVILDNLDTWAPGRQSIHGPARNYGKHHNKKFTIAMTTPGGMNCPTGFTVEHAWAGGGGSNLPGNDSSGTLTATPNGSPAIQVTRMTVLYESGIFVRLPKDGTTSAPRDCRYTMLSMETGTFKCA